jgi:hypothetical protein
MLMRRNYVNKHDISNCFKQPKKQTKQIFIFQQISTTLSSEIIQNKIHTEESIGTLSNSGGYGTKHSLLHYHRLHLQIISDFGFVARYSNIQQVPIYINL